MTDTENHRLPRGVQPRRYELTLVPDLSAATFSGHERIELEVSEPTSEIVLGALELEVHSAFLQSGNGARSEATIRLEPDLGRLVLGLPSEVGPGAVTLELSFSGTLNDKLRGFYRSRFSDAGQERVIATTQFEPNDARRAFPCWDEPEHKAVFSVRLEVDEDLMAVSNAAVAEEEPREGGRRLVRFADTIPMSTYLVAFIVGPLEATPALDVDGVALRIVHVPRKGHLTDFALEAGAHALRFFSEWFAIAYPGDKLDLIALPDFAAGAMENLGAVTFRESVLLVDPGAAARVELERVADVISHEIAHMWFGDLVTMRWWNGLWLNEAFATYMEMLCVDHLRPEWERWVSFGRSRGAAMVTDGLSSTRPIEFPVLRPEDAEGMFDVLTYEKGAGVLRMLERYLGEHAFRSGIRRYLDTHLYANAETTDLWDAIEAATGEPARATMDSWIFQGGYPLVSARLAAGGRAVALSQEPFRYRSPGGGEDHIGSDWQVPVLVRAGVGQDVEQHRALLSGAASTVELSGPPSWVVVNAGGSGFYRTRYGDDLRPLLLESLSRLDTLERFNLVADTWAAVLAGASPLADFLDLAPLLGDDDDANVWAVIVGALGLLDRVATDEDRPALQGFIRALLIPPFAAVGWEERPGENERTGTLRSALVDALGTIGADDEIRRHARAMHASAVDGTAELHPDLAGAVVSVVAATGSDEDFETFLVRFRNPRNPQEELRYLYGLAGFRSTGLVARALGLAVSEVRTQNAPFLIQLLLANRTGGPAAWSFVKERWSELLSRFPDNTIPRMLEGVTALCRPDLKEDVAGFCATHPLRSGQRMVSQILERQAINVDLGIREGPKLGAALAGRPSS